MTLRIGIIGARRRREGTGPFIARQLAALGAQVAAIVGTTPATLRQAQAELSVHGIWPRAYLSVHDMLSHEQLDAVAICAPPAYRRQHLTAALLAGLHVLCEKPLWDPRGDDLPEAWELIEALAASGRVLMVVEQWPYTLPDFCRLHRLLSPLPMPTELVMWMVPGDCGAAMVPQALPHPLSLLLALAGGGGRLVRPAADVHARDASGRATCCTLRFQYECASAHTVRATVLLQQSDRQPRAAGYGIDGRFMARRLQWPQYTFAWQAVAAPPLPTQLCRAPEAGFASAADSGPSVPGEDPLVRLLRDFLERCMSSATTAIRPTLADGVRLLGELYRTWHDVLEGQPRRGEMAVVPSVAWHTSC
jgi:predicted dehydrogenase